MWLSPSWLRVSRDDNPEAGVFRREQELKLLTGQVETLVARKEALEQALADGREQLVQLERQREQLQQAVNQSLAQTTDVQAQRKIKQGRLSELTLRAERLQEISTNVPVKLSNQNLNCWRRVRPGKKHWVI